MQILINGVDRTDRVQFGGRMIQINDNLNQRRDTCSFQVKRAPGQEWRPSLNEEVIITVDDTRVFGGIIVAVDTRVELVDRTVYDVSCSDFTQVLDRKLILERFKDKTVAEIIDFCLDKYDIEGFTMDGVVADVKIKSITFNRIYFSEVLEQLAKVTGYSWYVDYFKDIHFFPKNQELAPFNLTDTSNNYLWESLQIRRDLTQLRNIIYLEGGEEEFNERTEEFTAVGTEEERTYIRLAHKFSEMPTVTVNGTPVVVGADAFGNLDENYDAMWSYQEKYIRFTEGNIPAENDVITVTGIPLRPVISKMQSGSSIALYGEYEFKIDDNKIRTRKEAKLRAQAELEAYKNGLVEGSFSTYTPGLRSGQVIKIVSPLRDTNESFVIQSVTCTMRAQDSYIWNVRLATLRTMGIVEFMLDQLRVNQPIENDQEILQSFRDFFDSMAMSDSVSVSEVTSPPYMWMPDDPGDDASAISDEPGKTPMRWNYFTWEA